MRDQRITVAEYTERLLGHPGPKLDLDNVIEKLRPSTGGWESCVLEFKATYLPNPHRLDPDDGYPDKFRWDVFKAMLGMANANGGCVVVGIAEKKDRTGIEPGCYDPAGIITDKQKEDKDLVAHFIGEMFNCKKAKELEFRFLEAEGKGGKDEAMSVYRVASEKVDRLKALVSPYVCRSEQCACNAIAVIVRPIPKGDLLISVTKERRNKVNSLCYWRELQNAQNLPHDDGSEIGNYQMLRDPYDNNYHRLLFEDSRCEFPQANYAFSNVTLPESLFMGRDGELKRIREVCVMGKIPLVWATGGTGKTQLLLKYAQEYEREYFGGSVFLQLDGVKTWDRLFQQLAAQKTSTQTARAWLGLPEYVPAKKRNGEADSKNMILAPLVPQEIVDSIVRKCKSVGPVLLVLDNIDEPKDLLSEDALKKVFPRGRPQGLDIIASARSKERITFSRAPNVEPIQLHNLAEDVAKTLLCGGDIGCELDSPYVSEAIRILGCRAFYLKKIAYLIEDAREDGFEYPVQKVVDDMKRDLMGAMNFADDDPQAPGVMWRKWTLPRIQKMSDGEKIATLTRAIAFYLPTGVPLRILEGLWYSDFGKITGRKILDAIEDGSFARAMKVICRYDLATVDEVNGRAMMHRLDQLAIRKESEQDSCEWVVFIGNALAVNPCMAPADWVELLSADGTWMRFCPWGDLNGQEYAEILRTNPSADSYIPDWSRISPNGWTKMLRETTRFDNHPECRFSLLEPADVLEKRPELKSRFDFSKLTGWQWGDLIRKVPSFAEECPFDRFSENDWEGLISQTPQSSEIIADIVSRNRSVGALESLLKKKPDLVGCHSGGQDQPDKISENDADPIAIQCGVPESQVLSLSYLKHGGRLSAFVLREWPQLRPFVDMAELKDPHNGNYCLWLLRKRPCFVDEVVWHETIDPDCYYLTLPWCLSSAHVSRAVDEKLIDEYYGDRAVMGNMMDRYPEYAEARGLRKRLPKDWVDVLVEQMEHDYLPTQFKWEGLSEEGWYEMFMEAPRWSIKWGAGLVSDDVPVRVRRIGEELMTLNDGLSKVEYLLRELGTADANIVLRLPCDQEEVFFLLTVYLDSYFEKHPKLVLSRKPAPSIEGFLPWTFWTLDSVLSNPDSHTLFLRYENDLRAPDMTILQIYRDVSVWLSSNPSCVDNGGVVEIRHAGSDVAK